MAREFIDEERLDEVVGGAFNYYTNKAGQRKCVVDGVGTYYVTADAFGAVAAYSSDTSKTAQDVVNWAVANGYFSSKPF